MSAWRWEQSRFGGGGYITGLALDPFDPQRLYARCDVAGCFVSEDGGAHWQTRNAGLTRAHEHMVAALVPSPFEPGLVLRCSGDARGGRTYGSIHRSVDHGATWTEVCTDVDFYGNGPTRCFGEVCSFDPFEPSRVLVGGYRAGLWASDDAGLNWRPQGLGGERIGCVVHHPGVPGLVYAGTIGDNGISGLWAMGDAPLADVILEHGDVPRGTHGSLYVSADAGRTWTLRHRLPDWSVNGLALDPDDPDLVLAAARDGVYRSTDGGLTFTRCADGLETDLQYDFVRRDPHRPGRYLTAPHFGAPDIPVHETLDSGVTWRPLKETYTEADITDYPAYVDAPAVLGDAISELVFHPDKPETFFITGYYGVSRTDDNGSTFTGQGFSGTETTCLEAVVADPRSGRLYVTPADHVPAVSEDDGRGYRPFGKGYAPSAALAVGPHDPGLILFGAGAKRRNVRDARILRSTDGGLTNEVVRTFHGKRFVQALAASPTEEGRFYAYVDGDLDDSPDSAGLQRSDDGGLTWHRLPGPFPDTVHRLPVEEDWIESELLPCVVYQKRNAAGANQLLACDPSVPGRLYAGEWSLGVFRSDDAGASWRRADAGLPFGRDRLAVLSHVLADPERPGRLYAGFVGHGLWRSEDSGESWSCVLAPDPGPVNATSVAVRGGRLAVVCEPMWWTDTPARVLVSEDDGGSWQDIHPTEYGAVRWKGVAIDPAGRIHAVSCGNGAFVAHPAPPA
ncbi:hypothetical protein [Streptomyces sp. NPDC019224]|uniref:hypothetical protein n=1 Tax=Streptomyces sp. NPDC019224 TaxID=3154484 RepID=UPI0033DD7C3C